MSMTDRPDTELDRRPLFLRALAWTKSLTRMCAEAGISPNAISVFGLVVAIAAGILFALTSVFPGEMRALWLVGAVLLPVRILANTLDGMVAVEWKRGSPVGVLYNEAPDRLADVAILIGAGYGVGGDPVLGYLGACTALFVAYVRTLASKAGAPGDFSGPMAKGHRMVLLILGSLYSAIAPAALQPSWGPEGRWGAMAIVLAVIFVGGVITAARRLKTAGRRLRNLDDTA
jgi:phosphatidylglycerophosphate synthase